MKQREEGCRREHFSGIIGWDALMKYGFYDRLEAEFPSQFIVDVTERCNLACIHCGHPSFRRSRYYGGRSLNPDLNAKLVDEVRHHGQGVTQYIRYSASGEPLLHPHLCEMLLYAVERSGVTVTLTTNGTLMNEKRIEQLLLTGVDLIDISIDAYMPETYANIRVHGDLNVTRRNVLRLLQKVKEDSVRTKVVVSYVEQPQNAHETKDFETFWKNSGAYAVVVRRRHSNAGAVKGIADLMREEGAGDVRRPCLYLWERMVLNPRGYLAFCPADWTHGSTILDYRTTTIYETWQGEFYQSLREAHLTNQYAHHRICGQCPDWKAMRWPTEGSSYADMIEELNATE